MRTKIALILAALASAVLAADDHIVDSDLHFDFSRIKSFAIRKVTIASSRSELNNALVVQNLKQAITTTLTARGLKQVADHPDVYVDLQVDGQDYTIGPGGRAHASDRGRGGRRGASGSTASTNVDPPDFTAAALVLDLVATSQPELLVWRGVYRDTEKNASKMAEKLPADTTTMLTQYPPKRTH